MQEGHNPRPPPRDPPAWGPVWAARPFEGGWPRTPAGDGGRRQVRGCCGPPVRFVFVWACGFVPRRLCPEPRAASGGTLGCTCGDPRQSLRPHPAASGVRLAPTGAKTVLGEAAGSTARLLPLKNTWSFALWSPGERHGRAEKGLPAGGVAVRGGARGMGKGLG